MDDQFVADAVERHFTVGLVAPGLEQIEPALFQLGVELAVIIAIGAVGVGDIGLRGLVVVSDENALGDAPVRRIGLAAAALAAFGIFRPVALHPFGHQKVRRDRIPAARRGFGRKPWPISGIACRSIFTDQYLPVMS